MIFLFTLVEPDNVTKAVFKEESVTRSISLAFLLFLISPCIPNLRTFEQQVSVCDVMKRICAIRLFCTVGLYLRGDSPLSSGLLSKQNGVVDRKEEIIAGNIAVIKSSSSLQFLVHLGCRQQISGT